MQVFMTGASGYLGGVVAEHLVAAGHAVTALARSEEARSRVEARGARAVPGDLGNAQVLRGAAQDTDAVVHLAVDYFDPQMREIEQGALEAMLSAPGAGRIFVYTSTGLVYPDTGGRPVTEDFAIAPESSPQPYKVLGEQQVLAADKVAATVIRASMIYGRGGSGLLDRLIDGGRQQGMVPYIGEGANEWSSVHVDDLAELYVAAVAKGLSGVVVNAASRTRTSMRQLAEAVAAATGARAVSLTVEQAEQTMGAGAAATLTRSSPLDPTRAERLFGWRASSASLVEELTTGSYVAEEGESR
jgi:nucleoside-diphosphate-sugar epimerase